MMALELVDIYGLQDPEKEMAAVSLLFLLLKERKEHQNISHKKMPSFYEHCAFVASKPYAAWYLILDRGTEEQGGL